MKSSQSGFTLIELLVTTIVLSVGLLGLAQLEIFSIRHNHEAYLRSQATHLAQDIADRMRANPQGVNNGDYERLLLPKRIAECIAPPGCSSSEMAQNDAWEWRISLGWQEDPEDPLTGLPGGQGIVCLDSTPQDGRRKDDHGCDASGTIYAIKIWWYEDRSHEEDEVLNNQCGSKISRCFVTSFRP